MQNVSVQDFDAIYVSRVIVALYWRLLGTYDDSDVLLSVEAQWTITTATRWSDGTGGRNQTVCFCSCFWKMYCQSVRDWF